MWDNRSRSMVALDGPLSAHRDILKDLFADVDRGLGRFASEMVRSDFDRACGFVLAKSRHLAHANYSLVLDGLGQEAGALLRPLIECFELLLFFQQDPSKAKPALEGKLPSAGEIARAIKGRFGATRKYLNDHASHVSFDPPSLRHLLDFDRLTLRSEPVFSEATLDRNLKYLACVLTLVLIAAVNCLQTARPGSADELADSASAIHGRVRQFANIPEVSSEEETA